MNRTTFVKTSVRAAALALVIGFVGTPLVAGAAVTVKAAQPQLWAAQNRTGDVELTGQVPLIVSGGNSTIGHARLIGAVTAPADIALNFGLPLHNIKGLNGLIVAEARTHRQLSRAQIIARFSPPQAQYNALRTWLLSSGFIVTHISRDRLEMTAKAPAAMIERTLHVHLNVYRESANVQLGVRVPAQDFYANTTAPIVPARLGIQTVSGLSNIDQFFTDTQLDHVKPSAASSVRSHLSSHTRSPGYYPRDLRSMYDVTSTTNYGTGQTLGYTLWGAGEVQAALTAFATTTGETALTDDTPCVATGSPTVASSCTTIQEAPNHLLNVLENGNTNNNYGGNDETGLDVEVSHGMAPGSAEKYYLGDCSTTPSPGLTNGGSCNGSDVGLEDAMEDAANDPTLHSVSNSWGYGGEAEYGLADPFEIAVNNDMAYAAAAGTTFYFSTGDDGTYESGFPADNPYVVSVGGTSIFSTATLTGSSTGTLSSADTWSAGGSWCSNIYARPSWQNGAGVTANADCPGRAIPDISADADTNTAVEECYSRTATTDSCGGVGGTSVAGPIMNGMQADTANFVAAQTYPGATPSVGFEGPIMYMLGNSGNSADYYRDVLCGNDANPSGSPDGASALPGWDQATGWGEIDWLHYSTGYAQQLGATNLTTPSSLSQNYSWTCAQTPGNPTEHGISFPNNSVGYAAGTATTSPWFSTYLPSGAWGATNTIVKTTNGGTTWIPSDADMLDIACTSNTNCIEVGDGGVINLTQNGGTTWNPEPTVYHQALTQVQCPSSTVCYAAGDRGTVLVSNDGGQTWSFSGSADGNPIYGLSCPTTTNCFAVDNYGHVDYTTNGGSSWTLESTPATTPGINVPGSGGPNPYAGLFGISCPSATTCVAVGGYTPSGAEPIETTTNGTTWTARTSTDTANNLFGVNCLTGTTTCFAVGAAGTILKTTNLTTWTAVTSGTTKALTGITCLSATSCVATGQTGTIDVLSGSTWTAATSTLGASAFLASVTCLTANDCFAVGHNGVTVNFDSTNVLGSITLQAGGGYTGTLDALSCASVSSCVAVGASGTIITTTNGGQTWTPSTSGVTTTLDGVSCAASDCVATGASAVILGSTNGGATWASQTSGLATTVTLNAVSCTTAQCVAVGTVPSGTTAPAILTSANGGGTWTSRTSSTNAALSGVTCVATSCLAVGAVVSGHPLIDSSTNGGATWTTDTSAGAEALTSVACVDTQNCVAGGAIGTVEVTNNGGTTWTQQGDPISGPLSALNLSGPTSITAIDAAACSAVTCAMAGASSVNVMITPLLTVTVNQTGQEGSTPPLSGLAATSPAISTSPTATLTGTLTCSTTATSGSGLGYYPVSSCSGLAASGYTVVYDYTDSSYQVTPGKPTATISTPTTANTYAVNQNVPTAFSCSDALGGPGISSCTDSLGNRTGTDALSTSSPGTFTYSVTAKSQDGLSSTSSISYTVARAPIARITSPGNRGTYAVGQVVPTAFSCVDGASGPGITTCVDSNGASSPAGVLTTSVAGTFTYTVTATSGDGQTGTSTISYTVAAAPTATISSPPGGGDYAVGQSVPTSFSCAEGAFGPGLASCVDTNGASSPTGALSTSTPGTFTYSVTATSNDGQTATATISYSVSGPPTATITAPSTGGTYAVGQSVPTSFSCTEGPSGPGITSCVDTNGASSPTGALSTSTPGTFTYTVTATSADGQTGTATISYTVAAAPTASITSPASGATYAVGQSVPTSFSCTEGAFGPGLTSCVDTNGASAPSGALATSTPGTFTYTVTATSGDGQTGTATITYTVAAAPTASITSPATGGTYAVGQSVPTSFSCTEGAFGPGLTSCVDTNGASAPSGALATSTPGTFTYTVTATSGDGQTGTATITYTVAAAPTASITSPASGATYAVGQSVPTSFSCTEGAFGPGLTSCVDTNGASAPTGALATSTPGTFTYAVTATSGDGQTATATISYTVAAAPTASITSPASGNTYAVGQSVPTSFSCTEGAFGPGLTSCVDTNGASSPSGALATSTPGTFTYTVTATSGDGQTGTATISYTVAAAPTASISSPSSGATYSVGEAVATTFSCTEGAFGPGLASCVDTNGASSPTGSLVTSAPGTFSYTVTATSLDGQTGTATISYTVASGPIATISSPATAATYAVGQSVPTSFSCADPTGPGITSCVDSNGASSPSGALVTSTPGTFTYTVTATSGDGQTSSTSIAYSVASPPTATITSPPTAQTYAVGQSVATAFSCSDSAFGPGISSCTDANGASSPTGSLVTSTAGTFTYTVTAVSLDGQSATASITYTVAKAPTVAVTPTSGGTYYQGQVKATTFSCTEGAFGPGIQSCVDSNGATSGTGALSTATVGSSTYSVTATSKDGQQTTRTITYTVAALPTATISSPATGTTYAVGQHVTTTYSCADGSFGPGIQSCVDSNGGTSGTGQLATSSAGTFTYKVTATSKDGGSSSSSIAYTVASAPKATISSPATAQTYAVGQSVPTSFSCTDSTFGPGISSCKDANGASSPTGALTTSTPGTYTYTVTATSSDGQTATASITYTVAKAPTVTVTPTSGGTYYQGQVKATTFSCTEGTDGPGILSCVDSNGSTSGTGALSTTSLGSNSYSVTATSKDGQVTTHTITYTVAAPPTATISSPGGGGSYAPNQRVATTFSCADGSFGPGIQSCVDSNGSTNGSGLLKTSSPGANTYTVTATSKDGATTTTSISYTVT